MSAVVTLALWGWLALELALLMRDGCAATAAPLATGEPAV
jgi:hypothetical protein